MAAGPEPAAGPAGERVYKVREINGEVRTLLELTYAEIGIEGEISNLRVIGSSGHWYFTLKDEQAQIPAAMFKGRNRAVTFTPEDGMAVVAFGQLSLYEARGSFQIIVSRLVPRGAGALHAAFERLKARLAAEGLFDAARKRPLPFMPRRIGVVTSAEGAAFQDILRVLARRHAGISILLVPTRVQGEGAAGEIAAAIERAGRVPGLDALIVGRGGGSLEDLWAFNEEPVARALAACPIPTISAVGHEVDITISDFVADLRAPTPSAAAEMVAASRQEIQARLRGVVGRVAGSARVILARLRGGIAATFRHRAAQSLSRALRAAGQARDEAGTRIERAGARRLDRERRALVVLTGRLAPRSLMAGVGLHRQRLGALRARLAAAGTRRLEMRRERVEAVTGRLKDLSPLAVLARGYALARLAETGELLRDASRARPGDRVDLRLWRGDLELEVLGGRSRPEEG